MTKMIRPVLMLPEIDRTEQTTQRIPAIINPITPIPPALLRPFFSGQMPLPPSVDDAYTVISVWITNKTTGARIKKHRIGPSQALTNFKERAAWMLKQATIDRPQLEAIQASAARHIKTPLGVRLGIYFASPWRRDLDGPIKFAIDAAFAQINLNDNQVVHIDEIDKQVDPRNPRVEIEIRCLTR